MTSSGVIIGQGRFGDVRRHGNHAPFVAVKSIKIYDDRIKKCTERELKAFEKFSHPNVVKFYEHKQKTIDGCDCLMIYMEFCERLSLKHVLDDPTVVYNLKTVFGWTEQLASALLCLKANQILHRDIKPENVFVTNRFILKLGDFGLGKDMGTGSSMSRVGTERYMSPEASGHFGNAETNYKSDLYAMALVLWEMAERRKAFSPELESQGIYAIFDDLKNYRFILQFTDCDAELVDLISQCIKFDHTSRPDIEEFFEKIARLNLNYNEETFQPLTGINQQNIQKPNCIRKVNTNKRDLLQKELTDQLNKINSPCIYSGYNFDELKAHFVDDEQEESTSFLNDAISMLKSLALQQGDFQLLEMFEKRIQNFSKLPDDYIFCNDKCPNFPPMIDQELLDFLTKQKYEQDFIDNIKSALKMCEHCFRNDFKTWLLGTLAALDWHRKAMKEPHYLLEAIEQIHSVIGRILDNPFYKQWFVVSLNENYRSKLMIEKIGSIEIMSKKGNSFTKQFHCFHKGLHIESCLKDLQETLENILKETNFDQEILKDYLQRNQPKERVFPYRVYRFEWGKRVNECEEIKKSDIASESLDDYESLRQAYESALKILVTHSKRKEKSFNENDQINQIKSCLFQLKKPRKCPNYFYFHARELKDHESQNLNNLCIYQNDANQVTFFVGDDLILRWKKTASWLFLPYAIIEVDLLIDLLSDLLLKYESSRPHPFVSLLSQSSCSFI